MADRLVVGLSLIESGIGIAGAVVATIAWRYRTKRVGRLIVVIAVATSLYATASALQSFVTDPLGWRLVNNSTYPLGAALAVGSLFVVIEFTERESLQRPAVGALCAGFVLLDVAVSMTDPLHDQVIASEQFVDGVLVGTAGPLFYVHTVVSLGIVAVAVGLLVAELPATDGIYRRQITAAIAGFVVGMGGFAWQSFAPIHPAFDVATVGILGWCGLILWSMLTADFLDIVPIGRHRAVRSIQDPVITLDTEYRVVDSNPAARQLAAVDSDRNSDSDGDSDDVVNGDSSDGDSDDVADGDSNENWEGTPVASFFEDHPDLVAAIEAADARDVALDVGGETRHVTLSVSPIHRGGGGDDPPVGWTVVMRDVTELVGRQRALEATNEQLESARNRYRSLFENTPLVVWEEDLSETVEQARELAADTDDLVGYLEANPDEHRQLLGTIEVIDVNENAVEAYGAASKAELIDRFDELLTEESLATNRRLLGRLVAGDRRFREETTYQRLDGDRRNELVDVLVPEAHADDWSRVLVAGTDITDRERYRTRIETQNEWLERLAKVISHDLRTPLTTADNHLRLLDIELDDPSEPVAESLADLERTHERLRKFTEHLPQLARESTDVEAPVECELAAVTEAAWAVVETGSLDLVVENSGTLQADPQRLQQLFENLVGNVVDHATGGPDAASTVWVGTTDDGFYLADDGPGVSPEQGQEIFEYGMSTGSGSGVGLAIVRNITEAHGWTVSVADRAGGGARFEVDTTGEFAVDHHG